MGSNSTRIVLIVEDDDAIRDALREALVAENYQAVAVGNLASARRLLAEVTFDIVLLDVVLEGEHASELLDELQEKADSLPVLLVSAATNAEITARKYGVLLLPKPFGVLELLAAIEATIRRGARLRREEP